MIRGLAPDCEIYSARVLGAGYTGSGPVLLGGLRWAVDQGFDIVNMSLSTTKRQFAEVLHELADKAYFNRTILVAPRTTCPSRAIPGASRRSSRSSHSEPDSHVFYFNPNPPVEFFARGVDVELAWMGGKTIRATATASQRRTSRNLRARALKHPELTPYQLKSVRT